MCVFINRREWEEGRTHVRKRARESEYEGGW